MKNIEAIFSGFLSIALMVILIGSLIALYLMPTIIAFRRNHHYRWVILGVNAILGVTGVGYLISFAWAVWPKQTSVLDLLLNDPTSNDNEDSQKIYGRMGANIGALTAAKNSYLNQEAQQPKEMPSVAKQPSKEMPSVEKQPSKEMPSVEKQLLMLLNFHKEGGLTKEEFMRERDKLLNQK